MIQKQTSGAIAAAAAAASAAQIPSATKARRFSSEEQRSSDQNLTATVGPIQCGRQSPEPLWRRNFNRAAHKVSRIRHRHPARRSNETLTQSKNAVNYSKRTQRTIKSDKMSARSQGRSAALTSLSSLFVAVGLLATIGALALQTARANAAQSVAPASKASGDQQQQQQRIELQPAAESLNGSASTQLGDLVAIGGFAFVEPSSGEQRRASTTPSSQQVARQRAGRLVDRIATPSEQQQQQQQQQQTSAPNKLDYIIDFMRANRLTKFCDLFFSPTAAAQRQQQPQQQHDNEIEQLKRELNSLPQFTLFVPTNEAFDLVVAPQLADFKSAQSLEHRRKFLMAHATGELIVPKFVATPTGSGEPQSVPTSSATDELARSESELKPSNLLAQRSTARWSSGRARERIAPPSSVSLAFSLAGTQMRVVTAPLLVQPQNRTTKLELIVNGANILSGHSHALQEPNNSSATYAIVHLIDRPLYPPVQSTLMELIERKSPQFGKLVRLSRDAKLAEMLEMGNPRLLTLFLPSEQALASAPAKLFDKLETNRTFLMQFLRSHIVDNVYYSGQLSASAAASPLAELSALELPPPQTQPQQQQQQARQLGSLAGTELDIESKALPTRQVLLVNGIPIIEQDLVALNGVAHLLARPITLEDDPCPCGVSPTTNNSTTSNDAINSNSILETASSSSNAKHQSSLESSSNWFRATSGGSTAPKAINTNGQVSNRVAAASANEQLEREESGTSAQRVRSQRSGSLVALNNREFYRPSTAPVNLQLESTDLSSSSSAASQASRGGQDVAAFIVPAPTLSGTNEPLLNSGASNGQQRNGNLSDLFDSERYKVVINAATRQRMREQQLRANLTAAQLAQQPSSNRNANLFAYDRPLSGGAQAEQQQLAASNRMQYSPGVSDPQSALQVRQGNSSAADQVASASSQQRAQRLLKFQAEDARDQIAPGLARSQRPGGGLAMPPAYDLIGPASSSKTLVQDARKLQQQQQRLQQQVVGKTSAPPLGSLNDCAFYDAECKRLLAGRLVRLPATTNTASQRLQQQQQQQNTQTINQPQIAANPLGSPTSGPQMFDSTFGETTTSNPLQSIQGVTTPMSFVVSANGKQAARKQPPISSQNLSPLAQPLPPWDSREEQRRGQVWSAASGGASDLSRIRFAASLNNLTRTTTTTIQGVQPNAPILLVPVQMFQDVPLASIQGGSGLKQVTNNGSAAAQVVAAPPIYFAAPSQQQQRQQFSRLQSGRLTSNLSAYDSFDNDNQSQSFSSAQNQSKRPQAGGGTSLTGAEQLANSLQQPATKKIVRLHAMGSLSSAYEPFNRQQQLLSGGAGSGGSIKLTSSSSGGGGGGGDISITSARLQQVRAANNGPAPLASQASNHQLLAADQLLTEANRPRDQRVVTTSPSSSSLVPHSADSGDFFQNRTIAEIMDDSGLRIDGQQVTFNRLHECLERADLLSLVAQASSGLLTAFMPTDSAFQRLVQQQAIAQQARSSASLSSRLSARLVDPTRRHLLPLIARSPASSSQSSGASTTSARLTGTNALGGEPSASDSALTLSSRLTLDCSAPQVRQLLLDHLSGQLVTPKQLQMDLTITTLSGKKLLLSSVPQKKIVVVDGQPVIAATRAKNGMVYVVNKFLNISEQMPNVVDLLEKQPQLSTFQSYLTFSSLSDRLKRETGPITIFAPTNEAFEQLSSAARQLINSDPSALADIMRGHIVDGAQYGKLISMRNRLKTMNPDQVIEAKVIKPNIYQLDNQLTSMRLIGTTGNGVVNSIDRLIVPVWLRVSMGSGTRVPVDSLTTSMVGIGRQPSSGRALVSDLSNFELGGHRNVHSTSIGNNLPSLNASPVRFDSPTSSSGAPQANSFTLATGGPTTPSFNNNNNITFDINSGFDSIQPSSNQNNSATASGRLRTNSFNSLVENDNSILTTNQTKNMQLIEKLATLMKARKFAKYLLRSRLSEQLKPDMNYVILVPTDQAVERLPRQIVEMLERDTDRLTDLVNFHVLDTTFEYINTIPDGQTLNTLNEKDILFNWHRNNTILTASGAVVLGGIQEENIALLIVDRVLYPTPGDLLSIVSKSPILSNFTSLLRNAKLEQQLSLAGPYTLFAPSDFAFNQLDKRDLEFLQRNKDTARRFLLRHICQPAIFTSSIALSNMTEPLRPPSTSLSQRMTLNPTLQVTNSLGEELILRQKNDYFSVNDVNFSYADVAATNGVVHVIDGLL